MYLPMASTLVLVALAQVSVAGFLKVARDVEHGSENMVGAALMARDHITTVTVTITTIPDYCLTTTAAPVNSAAPAASSVPIIVAATASHATPQALASSTAAANPTVSATPALVPSGSTPVITPSASSLAQSASSTVTAAPNTLSSSSASRNSTAASTAKLSPTTITPAATSSTAPQSAGMKHQPAGLLLSLMMLVLSVASI